MNHFISLSEIKTISIKLSFPLNGNGIGDVQTFLTKNGINGDPFNFEVNDYLYALDSIVRVDENAHLYMVNQDKWFYLYTNDENCDIYKSFETAKPYEAPEDQIIRVAFKSKRDKEIFGYDPTVEFVRRGYLIAFPCVQLYFKDGFYKGERRITSIFITKESWEEAKKYL